MALNFSADIHLVLFLAWVLLGGVRLTHYIVLVKSVDMIPPIRLSSLIVLLFYT